MAKSTITITVKVAWWPRPAAHCVAVAALPFVGADRAFFIAAKVLFRGVRVSAT